MSVRSLNKVILIGNLTRDPELRYTPAGTAVCTFGLATNRQWTTQTGETKEETEFHRIVAWNKLAELCSQLLAKGRKVYVEGRLATHSWTSQDGTQRTTTEIVIDDMIILDSKKKIMEEAGEIPEGEVPAVKVSTAEVTAPVPQANVPAVPAEEEKGKKSSRSAPARGKKKEVKAEDSVTKDTKSEDITPDDIPF